MPSPRTALAATTQTACRYTAGAQQRGGADPVGDPGSHRACQCLPHAHRPPECVHLPAHAGPGITQQVMVSCYIHIPIWFRMCKPDSGSSYACTAAITCLQATFLQGCTVNSEHTIRHSHEPCVLTDICTALHASSIATVSWSSCSYLGCKT